MKFRAMWLGCACLCFACGDETSSGPVSQFPPVGADCTGNADCDAGEICDQSGHCVVDPNGDECPAVAVTLTPVTPVVELLVDQSGSMDEAFGQIGGVDVDRWTAARYALTDPTVGAVTLLEDRVLFGATLYHSEGGSAGGTCPMLARSAGAPAGVPLLHNAAAIRKLFDDNEPDRDTPTAESIAAVRTDLLSFGVDADQVTPLVLVLVTDGNPDNCDDADAHDMGSQIMSETEVSHAWDDGIRTIPLSVGSDVSDSHMQRLANVGAGLALDASPGAPWYRGNDPQELVNAFNEIIHGVRTCTFTLNGMADPADASAATVTLNGGELVYGTDWRLIDPSTMELLGVACDSFLASDVVDLDALFPCGTIID